MICIKAFLARLILTQHAATTKPCGAPMAYLIATGMTELHIPLATNKYSKARCVIIWQCPHFQMQFFGIGVRYLFLALEM